MTPEYAAFMHYRGVPLDFPIPEGVTGPVYCVGDSHVLVLQGALPEIFKPNHWDYDDADTVFLPKSVSKTAYAVGSSGHDEYLSKSYHSIPRGSKVIVSFGEIDCRHYVPTRHKEKGIPIEDLVNECMTRFRGQCLDAFMEKYRTSILGVYITISDHGEMYEDIVKAKGIMNDLLERYCAEKGALFIPTNRVASEEKWDEYPIGTFFGDTTHASSCLVPPILDALKGFQWKGFDYDVSDATTH